MEKRNAAVPQDGAYTKRVKILKIMTLCLWAVYALVTALGCEALRPLASMLTTFSACMLILSSRTTQGHYKKISTAYAVGIGIWCVTDLLMLLMRLLPSLQGGMSAVIMNLRLLPDVFFALGLILFMHSEYSFPHFQRVVLHSFALSVPVFLVFQKLILVRWAGLGSIRLDMFGIVSYFFVVVFTLILVFIIFAQTNFKGHTVGTNFSAVALVTYNLCELRMLFFRATGEDPEKAVLDVLYLLTLVVYAEAQSDPKLILRKPEPDDQTAKKNLSPRVAWMNAAVAFVAAVSLYAVHFFDARDLYTMVMAIMVYLFAFRSIQANELSNELLRREMNENARLEKLVNEKTKELQEMNAHLELLSSTDVLTGLYNRRYGLKKIEELTCSPGGEPFAILLMDLNYFKAINDTFGHDAGDEVLRQVGLRLMTAASGQHASEDSAGPMTAIRLGGDEFLVIVPNAESIPALEQLAERICRLMEEPIAFRDQQLMVSVCIGIARFPYCADELSSLYTCADRSMYSIKHRTQGSSYRVCEEKERKPERYESSGEKQEEEHL